MAASSNRWWLRGSRAKSRASRAINRSCTVLLAAPPAKPSSCPPRGCKRSQVAPPINFSSRECSRGMVLLRSCSRLGSRGMRMLSTWICSSTSGSRRAVSSQPTTASTTSSRSKAAGRDRGSRRRSRVIGTSRATASTTAPKRTSSTSRSSQASSPNTTRARVPRRVRPLTVRWCQRTAADGSASALSSSDPGCRGSRPRAGSPAGKPPAAGQAPGPGGRTPG